MHLAQTPLPVPDVADTMHYYSNGIFQSNSHGTQGHPFRFPDSCTGGGKHDIVYEAETNAFAPL